MVPAILRSRHTLLANIKSLEIQLANLQERLSVIVNWIDSQYYGFIDIPETVIIAMGRVLGPTSTKKNIISKAKVSPLQEAKVKLVTSEQSTYDYDTTDLKDTITDENEQPKQSNNPVVKLDKLSLQDIQILTDRHGLTNLHSLQTAFSKINCFESSSLLVCRICNKHFKLNMQMKKHALTCHSKSVTTIQNRRSQRKCRATYSTYSTGTNEEIQESVFGDVLVFSPTSDEEIDYGFDPLGDIHSDVSGAEDILRDFDDKIYESATDSEFKEEIDNIDMKAERIEDDPFISSDTATMLQTNESHNLTQPFRKCKSSLPFSIRKSSDLAIPTTKDTPMRASRVHKIVITASEYQKLSASIDPENSNCIICHRIYSSAYQARRHEVGFHLTKEDQRKYRRLKNPDKNGESDSPNDLPSRARRVNAIRAKITISALELENLVAALEPTNSFTCLVCSMTYSTITQARRHEIEVHLTKEEQISYRSRRKSLELKKGYSFICDICEKPCKHENELIEHKMTHMSAEELNEIQEPESLDPRFRRATRVDRVTVSLSNYDQLVDIIEPHSLICVICSCKYTTPYQARRHEVQFHLSKEEQLIYKERKRKQENREPPTCTKICDECGKPCKDTLSLRLHKQTHVPSEAVTKVEGSRRTCYRCLKCNSLFSDKRKYVTHTTKLCSGSSESKMQIHKAFKKHKVTLACQICGFAFSSRSALKMHMTKHTGEKNHLCTQCGASFSRSTALLTHELAIHRKERTHKCQYCDKMFVLKCVKNNHEKKHLGLSVVNCHICGFSFTSAQSLKKHITGVHENRRTHKCHLCDKSFKSSSSRNYHVKTHNNPNGRKRGLNKEVDHMKAAAKRRHCPVLKDRRVALVNPVMDSAETSEVKTQNTCDADVLPVLQKELVPHSSK